jgi:nucleotide-binding universal stress UspA family protein
MSTLKVDKDMHVVLVVGYDGTEPAQRALDGAADLLRDRPGRIEVVYVAHIPSAVAFSGVGMAAVQQGFDDEALDLERAAEETLSRAEVKWHFQHRNGDVAHELVKAADEQLEVEGPSTHVILVVGGSAHKIDRYLNSTAARVIRLDRFEVYVVP